MFLLRGQDKLYMFFQENKLHVCLLIICQPGNSEFQNISIHDDNQSWRMTIQYQGTFGNIPISLATLKYSAFNIIILNSGADPGFLVGGGHGPLTKALFGENVCENERIGSRGGRAPENFVCRSANVNTC